MGTANNDSVTSTIESAPEKPARRTRTHSNDALSDYLDGLGAYPLYTAAEELSNAEAMKNAEVEAWRPLLDSLAVLERIIELETENRKSLEAVVHKALARHMKRIRKGPISDTRVVLADKTLISSSLRAFDENRLFIDDAISIFAAEGVSEEDAARLAAAKKSRRIAARIRNDFVNSNLRLVVSVARRFHHYRMPLIDLIQEGNLGLIKAVHRYDHEKGFRFSTYAHWWIRQAVERSIMNKGAQIRMPVHIFDARREIAKAASILSQALSREPTINETAELTGKTPERVLELRGRVPREPMSLDDGAGGGEDQRSLAEVIADKKSLAPDESVIKQDVASHLHRIMKYLSPMEVDILRRRFGLDRDRDETLEEIGKSYSLSRERVRQIQIQGLKKMLRICQRRSIAA